MDFSNFLWMRDELSLLTIILVLFLYDTFGTEKSRRAFSWVACLLLAAQTAFLFFNLSHHIIMTSFIWFYGINPDQICPCLPAQLLCNPFCIAIGP